MSDLTDIAEVSRAYAKFKSSGLEFETYFGQNLERCYDIAGLVTGNKYQANTLVDKTIMASALGKKHPGIAGELTRKMQTDELGLVPKYLTDSKVRILQKYDADPKAGLAMLSRDFIPTESLYSCVDNAKRLAYSAKGQNASTIKQYAVDVEDYARQAVALRAEGNYTEAHNFAQKALERAENISRLASENLY